MVAKDRPLGKEPIMPDDWPSNITKVCEIGSQRGPAFAPGDSFDTIVNAFIERGWRVLQSYIEGRGQGVCDECVCLMGWPNAGEPEYPPGYDPGPHDLHL